MQVKSLPTLSSWGSTRVFLSGVIMLNGMRLSSVQKHREATSFNRRIEAPELDLQKTRSPRQAMSGATFWGLCSEAGGLLPSLQQCWAGSILHWLAQQSLSTGPAAILNRGVLGSATAGDPQK